MNPIILDQAFRGIAAGMSNNAQLGLQERQMTLQEKQAAMQQKVQELDLQIKQGTLNEWQAGQQLRDLDRQLKTGEVQGVIAAQSKRNEALLNQAELDRLNAAENVAQQPVQVAINRGKTAEEIRAQKAAAANRGVAVSGFKRAIANYPASDVGALQAALDSGADPEVVQKQMMPEVASDQQMNERLASDAMLQNPMANAPQLEAEKYLQGYVVPGSLHWIQGSDGLIAVAKGAQTGKLWFKTHDEIKRLASGALAPSSIKDVVELQNAQTAKTAAEATAKWHQDETAARQTAANVKLNANEKRVGLSEGAKALSQRVKVRIAAQNAVNNDVGSAALSFEEKQAAVEEVFQSMMKDAKMEQGASGGGAVPAADWVKAHTQKQGSN